MISINHEAPPIIFAKENYEQNFKKENLILLELHLRGGIMFRAEYSVKKYKDDITVLDCLLWIADGFMNTKTNANETKENVFMPSTARHMAIDQYFLFKNGVIPTAQHLFVECHSEGRRLYYMATKGKEIEA